MNTVDGVAQHENNARVTTDIYDERPWRHLRMTTSKKLLIGRKKTKGSQTMNETLRIVSKGITAVSYTHLDVYKRQVLIHNTTQQ